ncbi:MAG: hypothetical protein WCH44_15145 [Betaproteobacteria bacterium]
MNGRPATLAELSRQAEAAGAHDAAQRLAQASLRRDPDNTAAAVIRAVAQRGSDPVPEEKPRLFTRLLPPSFAKKSS